MPMIDGIDGMKLIQAFRQGREDKITDTQKQLAMAQQNAGLGLMGQLYTNDNGGGGVAGNYASPNPGANVAPTASPQSFDQAFNPQAMGALATGGAMPSAVQPVAAPVAPATPAQPAPGSGRHINYDVLTKMSVVSPGMAKGILDNLKNLSEVQVADEKRKNVAMGRAAQYLHSLPMADRPAALQSIASDLVQAGWPPDAIAHIKLDDAGLTYHISGAMDLDKLLTNDLEQRKFGLQQQEFEAGKTVPVTAGGSVALIKPDGTGRYVVGGAGVDSGPAPVQVHSADDYAKLPPGARYTDPNGHVWQKAGGPTQPASGNF